MGPILLCTHEQAGSYRHKYTCTHVKYLHTFMYVRREGELKSKRNRNTERERERARETKRAREIDVGR